MPTNNEPVFVMYSKAETDPAWKAFTKIEYIDVLPEVETTKEDQEKVITFTKDKTASFSMDIEERDMFNLCWVSFYRFINLIFCHPNAIGQLGLKKNEKSMEVKTLFVPDHCMDVDQCIVIEDETTKKEVFRYIFDKQIVAYEYDWDTDKLGFKKES